MVQAVLAQAVTDLARVRLVGHTEGSQDQLMAPELPIALRVPEIRRTVPSLAPRTVPPTPPGDILPTCRLRTIAAVARPSTAPRLLQATLPTSAGQACASQSTRPA